MTRPLNLASRPFRNERLPAVLFAAATFILLIVTVQHAVLIWGFFRGRSVQAEVEQLEADLATLQEQARKGEAEAQVPPPVLAEWRVLTNLVDQRTFWWSQLLAAFEETLPRDVRVLSIAPKIAKEGITLDVAVSAQGVDAALNFVRILEEHPQFDNVYPSDVREIEGGVEVKILMRYKPPAAVALGRGNA